MLPLTLLAQEAPAGGKGVESLPISAMFGFERVRLPQGERMGLMGGSLLFDIGEGWHAGPAVYGAATGQRGGFFVGGIELQRHWVIGPGWSVATGLYAGGGGGAAAPVGGGLMLRPAVSLLKDVGASLQLGLSASSVRFPSGDIRSNQLGLMLVHRGEFVHLAEPNGAGRWDAKQATGLGFDRMALTATRYAFTEGSARRIDLAGARAERRSADDTTRWGIEAAAAARGDAAGYMEILATGGLGTTLNFSARSPLRVGVRGGLGLGGGGGVPTAGGTIGKLAGTVEWNPFPGWTLGGEYGGVRALDGPLRARLTQVWLGIDLEPRGRRESDADRSSVRTEWVGVLQHHTRVQRRDGSSKPLDLVGLKLNRYLGEHVYLSGQAHSAYAGGAGAYSIGLFGAGWVTSATAPLRLGIEALAGAAGGGGVETSGGAIAQGLLWAGWATSPRSEWRAGIGALRGLRGGHDTPVMELSWSRAFGMAGS